jgi:hypothetical protein
MKQNRFDVLPVDDGPPNPVREFFATRSWGRWDNDGVSRFPILRSDILPCSTPVLEVLREMVHQKRNFYFLGLHDEVVGLISMVHLNSREAKIAVNALLVTLEDLLSEFLQRQGWGDEELLHFLGERGKKQFEAEKMANQDHNPLQNFYLGNLFAVVREKRLYRRLGYETDELFQIPNELVTLRNRAMHAVRSLVTVGHTAEHLWDLIERAQDMSFRLMQELRAAARSPS